MPLDRYNESGMEIGYQSVLLLCSNTFILLLLEHSYFVFGSADVLHIRLLSHLVKGILFQLGDVTPGDLTRRRRKVINYLLYLMKKSGYFAATINIPSA